MVERSTITLSSSLHQNSREWAPMTQQQPLVTEAMNVQSPSFNHNIVFQSSSKVCMKWADDNLSKLGGIGKIVDVGEAKFGKKKYNRGRVMEGQWLFGGIERGSRKIFVVPVQNRTAENLIGIIKDWIEPGTTIMSDCWKPYDRLDEEGFQHLTVNHSYNFVDPDSGTNTQSVERMWRDVRGHIPKYSIKKELLSYISSNE